MTLGGRPQKDEGHKPKNLSLDKATIEILIEVRLKKQNESEFVEKAIREQARRLSFSCLNPGGKLFGE